MNNFKYVQVLMQIILRLLYYINITNINWGRTLIKLCHTNEIKNSFHEDLCISSIEFFNFSQIII